MKIILEYDPQGDYVYIDSDDFDKVLKGSPKTLKQLIQDDIASNIDSSGWCKYREVLKELKIISESDVSKWNIKPSIGILPGTKESIISLIHNS